MKIFPVVVLALSVVAFPAFGCGESLAGKYGATRPDGQFVEALWLKVKNGNLQAYFNSEKGWYLSNFKPQDVPPENFAKLTKQPAPSDLCVIAIEGAFFARVPKGWSWGPWTINSGYTLVTMGGAHELERSVP